MSSPRKQHARELFAGIAGDYDRWAQLLSFGQDRRWHELLNDRLGVGSDALVADVATGTAAVAIDLARRHGCRVIGVDQSEEMLARGRRRVDDAGLADRIELRIAPALDTLRALPLAADIDLAFIDADKQGYVAYWSELVPRVRSGGLLLADNVLWSGRIVDADPTDTNLAALRDFNDFVAADDRVEVVVLTAFDGLTIARKR